MSHLCVLFGCDHLCSHYLVHKFTRKSTDGLSQRLTSWLKMKMRQILLYLAVVSILFAGVLSLQVNDTTVDRNFPATASINYAQGPGYNGYNGYNNGYYTQQNQYANRQGCLSTGEWEVCFAPNWSDVKRLLPLITGTLCTIADTCCTKACKLPGGGASKKARACCLPEGAACDPNGDVTGLDGSFCCRGTKCQTYKQDQNKQGSSDVHVCMYDSSQD